MSPSSTPDPLAKNMQSLTDLTDLIAERNEKFPVHLEGNLAPHLWQEHEMLEEKLAEAGGFKRALHMVLCPSRGWATVSGLHLGIPETSLHKAVQGMNVIFETLIGPREETHPLAFNSELYVHRNILVEFRVYAQQLFYLCYQPVDGPHPAYLSTQPSGAPEPIECEKTTGITAVVAEGLNKMLFRFPITQQFFQQGRLTEGSEHYWGDSFYALALGDGFEFTPKDLSSLGRYITSNSRSWENDVATAARVLRNSYGEELESLVSLASISAPDSSMNEFYMKVLQRISGPTHPLKSKACPR